MYLCICLCIAVLAIAQNVELESFGLSEKRCSVSFPLDAYHPSGLTPLHIAVLAGNLAEVRRLVNLGANLDAEAKCPEFFLSQFDRPDKRNLGKTPLMLAVEQMAATQQNGNAYVKILELLLESGADPNRKTRTKKRSRNSALTIAVCANVPLAVSLLLEKGADPNSASIDRCSRKVTPLEDALDNASIEVIELLIGGGADPLATVEPERGPSPTLLEYACLLGRRDAASILGVKSGVQCHFSENNESFGMKCLRVKDCPSDGTDAANSESVLQYKFLLHYRATFPERINSSLGKEPRIYLENVDSIQSARNLFGAYATNGVADIEQAFFTTTKTVVPRTLYWSTDGKSLYVKEFAAWQKESEPNIVDR